MVGIAVVGNDVGIFVGCKVGVFVGFVVVGEDVVGAFVGLILG